MLRDARTIASGSELTFDVAVIGGGPAGIAIVDRLRGTGLRAALIESGGENPHLRTQKLFAGASVGRPYYPLDQCRARVLGGSSTRWGGWSRPLEPVDFEHRDWVPGSGWPISHADLQPFYEDTADLMELPSANFDLAAWSDRLPSPLALPGPDFENTLFLFSPPVDFGKQYRARLAVAENITTLLWANVTQLRLDQECQRVQSVRVQTLTGITFTVRARMFVLATGAIENARLLLASVGDRPAGLGNEHDLVGRYFMEHPHVAAGQLLLNTRGAGHGFYRLAAYPGFVARGLITPTAEAARRHQRLACSISLTASVLEDEAHFVGWPPEVHIPLSRLSRGMARAALGPAGVVVRPADSCLRAATRQAVSLVARLRAARTALTAGLNGGSQLTRPMYFRTEQAPSPDSRVTLGERRDELGMPEPKLDWRVGAAELDSISGWLQTFDTELREGGLGRVVMPEPGWEAGIGGGPHHMGTTRMAADPRRGVVDADCRVHSLPNLYIAGSSVFPTGGYANPTFTLLALALRLADHLRDRLASADMP